MKHDSVSGSGSEQVHGKPQSQHRTQHNSVASAQNCGIRSIQDNGLAPSQNRSIPPSQSGGISPWLAAVADPRMCLLLTALLGILAWRAGAPALCVYFAAVLALFTAGGLHRRLAPGSARRTLYFALFWPLLKLGLDVASSLWAVWPQLAPHLSDITLLTHDGAGSLTQSGLLPLLDTLRSSFTLAALEAGIVFLRLLVLMSTALALTSLTSPRSLGLALTWLLRPFAGRHAWKPALALALMAQYLPQIHRISGQTRTSARSRGLPHTGLQYWRIALPHMFRLLAHSTWKQALAIAGRHLATSEAWVMAQPLAPAALVSGAAVGAAATLLALL